MTITIDLKPNRKYPNIPSITDDPASHRDALRAIVEALNIGQRRTSDVLSSFIRVSDLVDAGVLDFSSSSVATTLPTTPAVHTHSLSADVTDEGALAYLNTVGTAQIDNLAVTQSKLALSSVGTAQLTGDAVTNAKLADMDQSRIKGRNAGTGTGDPDDLTPTEAMAILGANTAITFKDEAVALGAATVSSVNFAGRGITAVRSVNEVTATVTGGLSFFTDNTPGGIVAETFSASSQYAVVCNGLALNPQTITLTGGLTVLRTDLNTASVQTLTLSNAGRMLLDVTGVTVGTTYNITGEAGSYTSVAIEQPNPFFTGVTHTLYTGVGAATYGYMQGLAINSTASLVNQGFGCLASAAVLPGGFGLTAGLSISNAEVGCIFNGYIGGGAVSLEGYGTNLNGYFGNAAGTLSAGGFGSSHHAQDLGAGGTVTLGGSAAQTLYKNTGGGAPTVLFTCSSGLATANILLGAPTLNITSQAGLFRYNGTNGSPSLTIAADANECVWNNTAGSGTLTMTGGANRMAVNVLSGNPTITNAGRLNLSNINVNGSPTITLSANHQIVTGVISSGTFTGGGANSICNVQVSTGAAPVIQNTGVGATISGINVSAAAILGTATGINPSVPRVRASLTATATANCTVAGDVGRAEGKIVGANAISGGLVLADTCAWAYGDSTLGPIIANAVNAIQFFPGNNVTAESLGVGLKMRFLAANPAPVGLAVPAGAVAGCIWVNAAGDWVRMSTGLAPLPLGLAVDYV